MKIDKILLVTIAIGVTLVLASAPKTTFATYTYGETIIIHSDGSITPSSAPVIRNGNTYIVTDDVLMPTDNVEGIKIEKDNIMLDGAGHKVTGIGGSSAIMMRGRVGVTITRFSLENFRLSLEIRSCQQCIISGNSMIDAYYCVYLVDSSGNNLHHNNIFGTVYYVNSNNIWDNGYPSGGNYWDGYPYADEKNGAAQNLPGADGIGDQPAGEEFLREGGTNVDNYPRMTMQSISDYNPELGISSGTPQPLETSSSLATANPTSSPSVPEFPSSMLLGLLAIITVAGALIMRGNIRKKKKSNFFS
jgi:parallel beta-helix repeat protein